MQLFLVFFGHFDIHFNQNRSDPVPVQEPPEFSTFSYCA